MDHEVKTDVPRTVRCKMKCKEATQYEDWCQYRFEPVVSGSKENEKFFKYTPGGELSLEVSNQHHFIPGKEYFIDISLADTEE